MAAYVGFSYTRGGFFSWLIPPDKTVSHAFILIKSRNGAYSIFHVDKGLPKIVSVDQFFEGRRHITDLYEIPATNKTILRVLRSTGRIRTKNCTKAVVAFLLKCRVDTPKEVDSTEKLLAWVQQQGWRRIAYDRQ